MPSAEETIEIAAAPEHVLAVLADPEEAQRWFPLPVELIDPPAAPVTDGDQMLSRGELAGQAIEFEVTIEEVRDDGVALRADGAVACRIDSRVVPADAGSSLTVSLEIDSGGGLAGGVMATAATPLAAPWLREAVGCIRTRAEGRAAETGPATAS
jgi:carbon monoxide dehydrogenase subunit G